MKSSTLWFLCFAAALLGILFAVGTRQPVDDDITSNTDGFNSSERDDLVVFRLLDEAHLKPVFDEFGRALPAVDGENLIDSNGVFKSESIFVELEVDGSVEYKAMMNRGDAMVYAWQALEGDVYYDFHAHPPDAHPDLFTRYREGEGQSDKGTILAGYDGQHGWYWLNLSDTPVTIQLEVAGFYDEIAEVALY